MGRIPLFRSLLGSCRTHRLTAIVVVPPPVTGMTTVSAALTAMFQGDLVCRVRQIRRLAWMSNLQWSAYKHLRTIASYPWMTRGPLYLVPDAGLGMITTALMCFISRLQKRPVVLHHHVASYLKVTDWRIRLLSAVCHDTLHIVLSEEMREELRSVMPGAETVALSNAAFVESSPTPEADASKFAPGSSTPVLGMLGNLTLAKGVETAVRVVQELASLGIDARLVLAGPIDEECADFLKGAGADRVQVIGPVRGTAKQEFLRSIDLLLFPSTYANEAQPLVIWEAMSCGIHVLAFDHGYIREQAAWGGVTICEGYPELLRATETCIEQLGTMACETSRGFEEARDQATQVYEHLVEKLRAANVERRSGATCLDS